MFPVYHCPYEGVLVLLCAVGRQLETASISDFVTVDNVCGLKVLILGGSYPSAASTHWGQVVLEGYGMTYLCMTILGKGLIIMPVSELSRGKMFTVVFQRVIRYSYLCMTILGKGLIIMPASELSRGKMVTGHLEESA